MGLRSGKVFMQFDDGTKGWVPVARVMEAKRDGGTVASIRLRSPHGQERDVNGAAAARMIDAGATEVAPGEEQPDAGFGGAMGSITRQTVAGAPQMLAQMAPMLIPGAGWGPGIARTAAAFGAGAGADAVSRGVYGQEQDPMGSAVMGGMNAVLQVPFEGAAAIAGRLPMRFAKGALGTTRHDIPAALLEAKTPVSSEGMDVDQAFIKAKSGIAQRAIQGPVGQARSFPGKPLEDAIERFRLRSQKYDLLSRGGEKSAEDAFQTMQEKLRALYKTKQVPGARGGTRTQRSSELTATDVDGINQYVENAAKKLYQARKDNKVDDPSQDELMYKEIANVTNKMLNTIPFVERNNLLASQRIDLKRAKGEALRRSEGRGPKEAIRGLAKSPESMSKMAFRLNDPRFGLGVRTVPRQIGVAVADILSRQR